MEPVTRSFGKLLVSLAILLGGVLPSPCPAADDSLEYQVKAAFLLNFTKFIEWPDTAFASSDSPIAICILGNDPFGGTLDRLVEGESVSGRQVTVQRIKLAPSPKSCQVVYAGVAEKEAVKLLPALGAGVLTVGEGDTFARDGGMIAFVIENRRVRFEINQTVAENAGLKLSARLLNVAKSVEK